MHLLPDIVNNYIRRKIALLTETALKQVFSSVCSINFQDKLIQYWTSTLAGFFNNGYIVRPLLSNRAGSGFILRLQKRMKTVSRDTFEELP